MDDRAKEISVTGLKIGGILLLGDEGTEKSLSLKRTRIDSEENHSQSASKQATKKICCCRVPPLHGRSRSNESSGRRYHERIKKAHLRAGSGTLNPRRLS